MKLKLSFGMLLLLILLSACKKEKVGGECTYMDVTKKVTVTFIDGKLDGEFTVSFQPVGAETDEVYRMTDKQFKNSKRNFDLAALIPPCAAIECALRGLSWKVNALTL